MLVRCLLGGAAWKLETVMLPGRSLVMLVHESMMIALFAIA